MVVKNVIVIGASAGGVAALKSLVGTLPSNLDAAVFVVLHIPAYTESNLPQILSSVGPLRAIHPSDGDKLMNSVIYVAPADHHLLIERGRVLVKKGPKENRFRPSIDALFRSAAVEFGSRALGIILSGMLNDGTSGCWAVKRSGGTIIIQDPLDAEYGDMPKNVLEYVKVDYSLPATGMLSSILEMINEESHPLNNLSAPEIARLKIEVVIAKRDTAFDLGIVTMGEFTPFTCPECHGALVRLTEGDLVRFRCHTGHAYTASSLLASITQSVEEILWQGMRGMEEATMLLVTIAKHFREAGNVEAASLFSQKSEETAKQAQVIHDSVFRMEQYSEDLRFKRKIT